MDMPIPNVDYFGEHSITFTVGGVSKNTWTDWGLVPSSRHSEPVNPIWSQAVDTPGINGQGDLVRKYSHNPVNRYYGLRDALANDHRTQIKSDSGYDIFQPTSGSLSFIIADQSVSYVQKLQEIMNFMDGCTATMKFKDDSSKTYTVLVTVDSFSNGASFSTISFSYSVISET